jgi:hypothetical protein
MLWSASSQAVWELVSGGAGALLVSLFSMEWGCYAWDCGVVELKFCLFSVVFHVRCISSISPRFHFRKHTFCFLPLVASLESSQIYWFCSACFFPTLHLFIYLSTEVHSFTSFQGFISSLCMLCFQSLLQCWYND